MTIKTRDDLVNFVSNAKPGDSVVYHSGWLARDRLKKPLLDEIAAIALELAGFRKDLNGLIALAPAKRYPYICLTQRRVIGTFGASEYIATRTAFESASADRNPVADAPEPGDDRPPVTVPGLTTPEAVA